MGKTDSAAEVERAVETFATGFCFTRSFTHPYEAKRVGPLWVLRDAPRRGGDYRTEEWICQGAPAAEVDRIARRHARGRFAVCSIRGLEEPGEPIRAEFKALGYRLMTTEPLMVHRLGRVPRVAAPASIERVTTQELADRLAKAARARQVLPEHLTPDAALRQYVALIDERVVGWVRSITAGTMTWCSNMHVLPSFRRRGIGLGLLARMLRDDRQSKASGSVLLASHTGAKLYHAAGYEPIGELLLYTPRRS